METISLYIHIPFCVKKCRYCDFYSVPYEAGLAAAYLEALEREIDLAAREGILDKCVVRTVYIGGGTPTVLGAAGLWSLCRLVKGRFSLARGFEWTVECNPESFTQEKAAALLDAGVNRLSLGVQSLDDRTLGLLGRAHDAARSRELLAEPALGSFGSVNVDLIYGLPGQTAASLESTVLELLASPYVNHFSAYELTLADETPFGRHRSLLPLPGDDDISAMTERLWRLLGENGFEHYEVSNFAKPGRRSRHNEAYWDHRPYVGFGCAANSYRHPLRWGNVKDLGRYAALLDADCLPREFTEEIDGKKLSEELLFLGLRRADGIDKELFLKKCGRHLGDIAGASKIAGFIQQGLLVEDDYSLRPTERGMLFADAMARELMA
jgi:oxygen-independent coproporphyrinogen III oxidase